MNFILTGFTHDLGFRVFAFDRIGADRVRTPFTVKTDLALIRQYGIRIQELPLMFREMLEKRSEGEEDHALTFTEDEMSRYAKDCAEAKEAAAQKRKRPRRMPTENVGAGWRVPQLL